MKKQNQDQHDCWENNFWKSAAQWFNNDLLKGTGEPFFLQLGDSRKYPYHTTDGFSEFWGQGGILGNGILKAWGGVRSGIYTGDRQEFIPWKLFFMDVLNTFVNRARTSDISSLTPNNMIKRFLEYKYIHLTGFWEPFYVDSPFFNCRTR